MAFVAQGYQINGCALAAIASIVNIKYWEAHQKLKHSRFDPNDGITIVSIRRSLIKLGKKVPHSLFVRKSKRNKYSIDKYLAKLKSDAILCIDNAEYIPGTFHCVAWNAKHQTYWDPGWTGCKYFDDYENVFRIIKVSNK